MGVIGGGLRQFLSADKSAAIFGYGIGGFVGQRQIGADGEVVIHADRAAQGISIRGVEVLFEIVAEDGSAGNRHGAGGIHGGSQSRYDAFEYMRIILENQLDIDIHFAVSDGADGIELQLFVNGQTSGRRVEGEGIGDGGIDER
ncbi:MAG: hypothetical protein BWY71_01193 [Planctomycetes bacterium ADurb.Bin412]|nr:MAG: hypothetical protein BWY71_01193 [Planctomycetes bacterium ADurb.Bin412]